MAPVAAFFGAVFFGTAATATLAYTVAVQIARIAILNAVQRALFKKPNLSQTAADKLVTVRGTIRPQAFVYGQDMLSGPLLFGQVTGDNNKYLHRLVALTGREIESFEAFRFDDTDITVGVEIPDANDTVSSGKYVDVVVIQTQTGTSSQTALSQLTTDCSDNWTSAHRCRGWSTLYTRMEIKGNNSAFKRGAVQNLRVLEKGCKVYDPRLDSTRVIDSTTSPETYGSGSHRVDDDTTWEWSDNTALCFADWLIWGNNDPEHAVGMGESPDRVDYELVAVAADVCDELVVIPPSASPSNTQKRYTCNFTFYANDQRGGIKQIFETAMMGRCVFSQGKWRMFAGSALTATITLDESYLAGKVAIKTATEHKRRYNHVRGSFVDPSRDYSPNAYPPQGNATYSSDDGGDKFETFDQNACNNSYEAQRNAIIKVEQSRNQRVIRWEGNWKCFQIQPGKVVTLDLAELGFSGDKFFVSEWELDENGAGVNLTLEWENDSVWNDPAIGDYTTRSPTGDLVIPDEPSVSLSDATIHNSRDEATCYSGVKVGADGRAYYQRPDGSWTVSGVPADEWLGAGSGPYFSRCTITSSPAGSLDTGSTGIWQVLSSDRSYGIEQTSDGTSSVTILVEIASDQYGSIVETSATFDLEATYNLVDFALTDHEYTHTSAVTGLAYIGFDSYGRLYRGATTDGASPHQVDFAGEWYVNAPLSNVGLGYEAKADNVVLTNTTDLYFATNTSGGKHGIDDWTAAHQLEYKLTRVFGQGAGTSTVEFTLSIRDQSTQQVVAQSTITLHATFT